MDDAAINWRVEYEVAHFRRGREELVYLVKALTQFGDDTPRFDWLEFNDGPNNCLGFAASSFHVSWDLHRDADSEHTVHASFHLEGCIGKAVAYVVVDHGACGEDCACKCLKQQQWSLRRQSLAETMPLVRETLLTALQTVKACAVVQSQESKDAQLRQEQLDDMRSDYNAIVAENCADL